MEPAAYLRTDVGDCRQLQVPGLYTFGRASTSDFRPNTKSVSKRHAQLELFVSQTTGKAEAWVEDYHSTFGTYVGVSPAALEKISERTRLFFGLYVRFGHAPSCYQYLEFPDSHEPAPLAIPVSSLNFDERSVADTIKSGNARRLQRVPLHVTTEDESARQRRTREESPRSRIQDLVNHFEAKSPVNSPDAVKGGAGVKRGSSGNLSADANQMVMDMVTKIEQSPTHNTSTNSMNSQSGKEHSQHFNFRGTTPSPETSSKTHPNLSSQTNLASLANARVRTPSPDISLYSRDVHSHSENNSKMSTSNSTKALRVDCDWTGIAEVAPASAASTITPNSAPEAVSAKAPSRTTPSPVILPEDFRAVTPPVLAPSKESDSAKELDYSIYDYDLDEKHGASEAPVPVPVNAFRRNPSLWEDPALFDTVQESTSTRSMRSTPLLSSSRPQSMKSAPNAGSYSPTLSETMTNGADRPVSLRDQGIAELAQRTALITQSRQAFCDKKNATLNPATNQYPTYRAVAKQWERAVATVDSVDGGMCISLVLPSMRKVKIEVCGRKKNKVRVEARRQLYHGDEVATDKDSEYICEYKLDGLAAAIHPSDISHEYLRSTGLLCVFVNRVTPQDSQLYVQKNNLSGHTCVPYEPAKGSGLSKWLPSWLRGSKGKQGPTERHNQQELRRALKESTKENTNDNIEKNISKSSSRKSLKSAAPDQPRPETDTNANTSTRTDDIITQSKRASSPRAPTSSTKSENSKKKRDSARPRESAKSAGSNAGDKTGLGPGTGAPVVDRGTLLQEFIEKGDVDTNVEFI